MGWRGEAEGRPGSLPMMPCCPHIAAGRVKAVSASRFSSKMPMSCSQKTLCSLEMEADQTECFMLVDQRVQVPHVQTGNHLQTAFCHNLVWGRFDTMLLFCANRSTNTKSVFSSQQGLHFFIFWILEFTSSWRGEPREIWIWYKYQ